MLFLPSEMQKKEVCFNMHQGKGEIGITYLVDINNLTGKAKLIAKVEFAPNSWIGAHSHVEEEEIFYILEGKGLQIIDDEEKELTVGDVVITKAGQIHSLKNIGDGELKLISIIIPY